MEPTDPEVNSAFFLGGGVNHSLSINHWNVLNDKNKSLKFESLINQSIEKLIRLSMKELIVGARPQLVVKVGTKVTVSNIWVQRFKDKDPVTNQKETCSCK